MDLDDLLATLPRHGLSLDQPPTVDGGRVHLVLNTTQPDRPAPPPSDLVARLPTPLAIPRVEYDRETHPRVRLHWLVDTVELGLRWVVALALADALSRCGGRLPRKGWGPALSQRLPRPTLGNWVGALSDLQAVRAGARFVPAAFEVLPRFADWFGKTGPSESLLTMRNQLAHGGGLASSTAQRLLDAHGHRFDTFLDAAARATEGGRVVARLGARVFLLEGPAPEARAGDTGLDDGVFVCRDGVEVGLAPLIDFGPVCHVAADGTLQPRPGPPAVHVYSRAESDRLSYNPVGRAEAHSERLGLERLEAILPLARKAKGREDSWTDPLRAAHHRRGELIGRRAELARARSWVVDRDARSAAPRVGWVFAGPGTGKSTLMTALAADLAHACGTMDSVFGRRIAPTDRPVACFFHRFRGGDAKNSRRAFRALLLARLRDWSVPWPDSFTLPGDPEEAAEAELSQRLDALRRMKGRPTLWLLADGLDEVASHDAAVGPWLCGLAREGVLVLAAGREEYGLDKVFQVEGCEAVFPGGLPGMVAADIRAMLLERLGNKRYALLARDRDGADAVHNVFVERVVQHARGLPLYVHLLLEDIRAGRRSVHDEQALPTGLREYYDAMMEELGMSTVQRDLPLLIATLAVAEEPLDAEALTQLLCVPYLEDEARYGGRVQAALRVGHALLRRSETRDGGEGYSLYHQSLREYVAGRAATDGEPPTPPAFALAPTLDEAKRRLARSA